MKLELKPDSYSTQILELYRTLKITVIHTLRVHEKINRETDG